MTLDTCREVMLMEIHALPVRALATMAKLDAGNRHQDDLTVWSGLRRGRLLKLDTAICRDLTVGIGHSRSTLDEFLLSLLC